MQGYQKISEALKKSEGERVKVRGWIYRTRSSGKLAFVTVRDESGIIQVIVEKGKLPDEDFDSARKALIESSVEVEGTVHEDERAPNGRELHATSFHVIHFAEDFPITKDQSMEFLLDNRHLWLRSRKLTTILKIRSTLTGAIHEFFRNHDFYEFHPPILQPASARAVPPFLKWIIMVAKPICLSHGSCMQRRQFSLLRGFTMSLRHSGLSALKQAGISANSGWRRWRRHGLI